MHGNVWEWCADGERDYTADLEIDPSGAKGKGGGSFAVRGGGWFGYALNARSARRDRRHRDLRLYYPGFRFALRSTSREAGGPV